MSRTNRIYYFKKLIKFINWYPPYIAAGIRLKSHNNDFTEFVVQMKLRWYNKNLAGTHFGGSLYAMCDPFFVFILVANLGTDYVIWDKSASIDFVRPGKGKVKAIFSIPQEEIKRIKEQVDQNGKGTFPFETKVTDEHDLLVASLLKHVYIRKKDYSVSTN